MIYVNHGTYDSITMEQYRRSAVSDFYYGSPMLNRVLDQADLMDRMMQAIGVVAARAACLDRGIAWYEARCRCIACPDDRKCREWLAGFDVGLTSRPPVFCRNTAFFRLAGATTGGHQMEDCHEPSPAELEGTLAPRQA